MNTRKPPDRGDELIRAVLMMVVSAMLFGAMAIIIRLASQQLHPFQIAFRSEEHTSELQSLMRISYAVFCLKKKKNNTTDYTYQCSTARQSTSSSHRYDY